MKHFLLGSTEQTISSRPSDWIMCQHIHDVEAKHGDMIWISTQFKDWKLALNQLRDKTSKLVLLTYRYHRPEMQTALLLGARAYCHALSSESLLESVSRVLEEGGLWLPSEMYATTLSGVAKTLSIQSDNVPLDALTARERDTLNGILGGLSNKEIARQLAISERTVKEHVGTLLNKMEAKDRIGLLLKLGEFSHLKDAL